MIKSVFLFYQDIFNCENDSKIIRLLNKYLCQNFDDLKIAKNEKANAICIYITI